MLKLRKNNIKILQRSSHQVFLKSFVYKLIISMNSYNLCNYKLASLSCKSRKRNFLTRYKKKCWLTNRSRGYVGLFSLSRIKVKELAWKGLLVGVKRSSW